MIKFLFILVCVFFLLRLLLKPILRLVIQSVVNKMVNQQPGGTSRNNYKARKEGNINFDEQKSQKKYAPGPRSDAGEYIDYEEIK